MGPLVGRMHYRLGLQHFDRRPQSQLDWLDQGSGQKARAPVQDQVAVQGPVRAQVEAQVATK